MMDNLHRSLAQHGLVRAGNDRVLGGVIAGVGRRIGLDPWPARLLFVIALLVLPGSQFLVYPLLWIAMPSEARAAELGATGPATGTAAA
jgi:phage shock protein C